MSIWTVPTWRVLLYTENTVINVMYGTQWPCYTNKFQPIPNGNGREVGSRQVLTDRQTDRQVYVCVCVQLAAALISGSSFIY